MTWQFGVAALSLLLAAGAAEARLVRLEVGRAEPFAGGTAFGATGPYVRMAGRAFGELDPRDPRIAGIVGLDLAPRNARGQVEYDMDVSIVRPADPATGNRVLLYEVPNRGRRLLFGYLQDAPDRPPDGPDEPATAADTGNGWAFRAGYTVVWGGWEAGAATAGGRLAIRVPVATRDGAPTVKVVRDEFVFGSRVRGDRSSATLSYEPAGGPGEARLSVRAREVDPPIPLEAARWSYRGPRRIGLEPPGTLFEPGLIYDLVYPARDPGVLGIGFAATRDLAAFLRREPRDPAGGANPLAEGGRVRVSAVLAIGISQSGRHLRDFVARGFNRDEAGRKVFDGVLVHTAGAGGVFLDAEFGQPARTATQHEDHHFPEAAFPFAYGPLADPATGATAGRLRQDGFDPLVVQVNTSTEYWQKWASLVHTDPQGLRDVPIPPTVRLFLVAGTQHTGRANPGPLPVPCANGRNPHDPSPALRALLVALDRWVTEGRPPPASRLPRVRDGTLVPAARLGFPPIPGVHGPTEANHLVLFGDWVSPRHHPGGGYRVLVPAVDADGNEVAGVRLPDVAVPLGTYTGWNLYRAPYPEGELCDREGTYAPFEVTRAAREARGDPRPSLEERYGTREAYVARVAGEARTLVRAGLLLPEDAARYVERAGRQAGFGR